MNKTLTPKRPLFYFSLKISLFLALFGLNHSTSLSAQVILSEYIDGPGNNNAVEIANVGDQVENLNIYRLEFYNDGASTAAFSKPLSGQIAPGDDNAVAYTSGLADDPALQGYEHFAGNFNGNDAIVLRRGGAIVDILGNIGCDPGFGGWSAGGNSTKDRRLKRLGCVTVGASDPSGNCPPAAGLASEWVSGDNTFYGGLGFHNITSEGVDLGEDQEICEGESISLIASADAFSYRWSTGERTRSIRVAPTVTTDYSVTVEDSGCFNSDEITILVKPSINFNLDNFGTFCESDNIRSIPARQNGFFGRWSGVGIVGNGYQIDPRVAGAGVHTLTFVPNDEECYLNNTTTYEVIAQAAPVLESFPTLCAQDAPINLNTNQGGIIGNWSGQGVSNNSFNPNGLSGIIQLTFTPNDCGQTASTAIEVQAATRPALVGFGPVCELSAPVNLSTNQQGITGSWSGTGVNSNQFFPNGNAGNNTIIFTPDAGQCAETSNVTVTVTAERQLNAPFFGELCSNDAPINLGSSLDGVSGDWSGEGVSNNFFNPQFEAGNINLNFSPNFGECAAPVSTSITVIEATPYIAEQFDPICNTNEAIDLNTNQGGVVGNWSGAIVQNNVLNPQTTAGNYTITFSPNERCATAQTRQVDILDGPTITNLQIDPAACERPVGQVTASVQGGQAFTLEYSLDGENFQPQRTFDNLAAGDYTLIADDGRCVAERDFTIESTTGSTLNAVNITADATCNQNANINLIAGGTGSLFYSLNGTDYQRNSQFNNLPAGDYQAIVRDANFCFDTLIFNIPTPDVPEISLVAATATRCGEANGAVQITANGTGQLAYALDGVNFQNTANFTDLNSGNYVLTVRDETGCTATETFFINPSQAIEIQQVTVNTATCGTNNGNLIISVNNTSNSYQYAINDGDFQNSPQFNNLAANDYQIHVRDSNGCTAETTTTITTTDEPQIINTRVEPDACGMNSGRIEVEATGATNLQYALNDGNFQSANSFSNLSGGTYQIQIRDENGCTDNTMITVAATAAPTIENITPTATSCNENNGQISIAAHSANDAAIQYSLDNVNFQTEAIFTVLAAGDYTIYIKDENDCVTTAAATINLADSPIITNVSTTLANCENMEGTLTVETTGAGDLSYSLDGINFQSAPQFTDLASGDYDLIVRAENGCQQTTAATLTQTTGVIIDEIMISDATCENANGRLIINTINANGTVAYSINQQPFQNNSTFDNLPAGDYTITTRDTAACTDEMLVTLANQGRAAMTFLSAITCDENQAGTDTIQLNSVFGCDSLVITERTFVASNETNLTAFSCNRNALGRDTLFLQNSAGCDSLVITETFFSEDIETQLTRTVCNQNQVGRDTVMLQSTAGCDSLVITESIFAESSQTNFTTFSCNRNALGRDTIFLQNNAGCDSLVITETFFSENIETQLTRTVCNANQVGRDTVMLQSTAGCDSLVITESIFAESSQTNFTVFSCNRNALGRDTVFLQNSAGCDSLVITETFFSENIETQLTRTVCNQNQVGRDTVMLQSTAGCDSLVITTFLFTAPQENNFTESVCTAAEIRTDTTTIQSVAGCDSILNITNYVFTEAIEMTFTETLCGTGTDSRDTAILVNTAGCDSLILITETSYAQATESFSTGTTCDPNQAVLDTIIVMNTAGCDSLIISDLTLLASSETILNSTTCNANEVGSFTTILTNSVGCDSTIINNISLLNADECAVQLSFTTTDLACHNDRSGNITFSATVGTPPFDYQYESESGENGAGTIADLNEKVILNDLAAGIYTLQVTAANGLSTTQTITINQPTPISVETLIFPPGCQQASGSLLIATLNGGAGNYEYALDDAAFIAIEELPFRLPDALQGGDYNLTIRDAQGCQSSEVINMPNQLDLTIELPKQIEIGLGESVDLTPDINFIAAEVEWRAVDDISCTDCLNAIATPLNTNMYFVTVTDERGCQVSTNVTIIVQKEREIYLPNVFSPNGDGNNDFFTLLTGKNVAKINQLQIFNYYGDPMFERLEPFDPNVETLGWDGNFRGQRAQQGVYIFTAEVLFVDGFTKRFQGEFALVR